MPYMTYKQLQDEQKSSLDHKIETACAAIETAFSLSKHTQALAFSGGKDSTVLWDLIRRFFPEQAKGLHIIFGNTGVEFPESLSFARQIRRAIRRTL